MANYYFVGILLPDLHIGMAPELSFEQFEKLLRDNLQTHDFQLTSLVRRYYDIENLRCLWKEEPLNSHGNLDENALEEALLNIELLPDYVHAYLEKYETKESRLQFFPELIAAYYREEAKQAKGFVKNYLEFERKLRLIQTAFRAKRLNHDLGKELQFEDPEEEFIQLLLAQKDAKGFEPPEGFEELKDIFEEHYHAPIDLHRGLCDYRFQKVEQLAGTNIFSIDRILATMVQLMIVERWLQLDREQGNKLVDQYIKEQA